MADVPIRVGVIGTGVMGGHHTRIASALEGCRLVGICDADMARADAVARQYGVAAFDTPEALCALADAVVIAAPSVMHVALAIPCLQSGCHVLVEKPVAVSVSEAEDLLTASRHANRFVMVGHIERFNPAVTALRAALEPDAPFACDFQRLNAAPGRDQSADVILDLMIHDIDLALDLAGGDATVLAAAGHATRGTYTDHASALLRVGDGASVSLSASWVSGERLRVARVFTRSGQFTANLATRELRVYRDGADQPEALAVPPDDPLTAEHQHFLHAVRTGTPPATNVETALRALRVACAVQAHIGRELATPA